MTMLHQYAPYPDILAELVYNCKLGLDQSWKVSLEDFQRDDDHGRGGAGGLTLVIRTKGYDTYHPELGPSLKVGHYFPVPAATYDRRSWQRWLFERYLDVFKHEAMESFVISGVRPYAPSHGPGNDPYMVREVGTEADVRLNFLGGES